MLYFPRWKIALILLVVLAALVAVIPNFFSRETVANWPSWLPKQQLVLGLDLQGGAYLLYEVDRTDYVEKRLRTLPQRRAEGDARSSRASAIPGLASRATASSSASATRHRRISPGPGSRRCAIRCRPTLLGGAGVNEFDLTVSGDGVMRLLIFARGPRAAGARHRLASRSRSSAAASMNWGRPSRASSARATTASSSRRRASAILRASRRSSVRRRN